MLQGPDPIPQTYILSSFLNINSGGIASQTRRMATSREVKKLSDEDDDVLDDDEDDLWCTSQPSEYLREPHNGSVQPSRSHSWIMCFSIV